MSNALNFLLTLTDMLSPTLRQAVAITNTASGQIEQQFAGINRGGRQMASSVNELRNRLEAINRVRFGTTVEHEFNVATRAAQSLERQIERLEGRTQRGNGLSSLLGSLGVGVGAGMIGKQAFDQAANAESQQIAFKVLTGNKGTGDKLYGDIVKMADTTPYESQDLARSGKTMLGYGVNQKNIMPDLQMIGDIAAASDHPAESLQSLALAFGQVTAKGHLAGQETLQMINAGFNPLKEISDITGISMNNLDQAQQKGAISTQMVELAFKHATGEGGMYHDMMKAQSETLGGRWSTFMDGVHHKLQKLGEFLKPVFIGLMDFGTSLLNAEPGAVALGIAVGSLAVAINWNNIAIGTATVFKTAWAYASNLAAFATGNLTLQQWGLNTALKANPIGLIITLVAALVAGIIYAYNHFETFRGIVWGGWEAIKAIGTLIKDFVIDSIVNLVKGITGIGETLTLFFNGEWKKAWETGKQAAKDLVGVTTTQHAIENGKKVGAAAVEGYNAGVKSLRTELLLPKVQAGLAIEKLKKTGKVDPLIANDPQYADLIKKYGKGEKKDEPKERAEAINSGGQRNIVVTIGKQIEKLEIHVVGGGKEVAAEMEAAVRESLRRVLYSINGAVTN
jgi:tape measure domain-containing protein